MDVAVYPRLNHLLHTMNMSVAELERLIERRFGRSVNVKTLYRLTSTRPVQRADLEIAGAVATVLGVTLDDLFEIRTDSTVERDETTVLDPAESRRLAQLFDRQSHGALGEAERSEIERLVAEYARRLHEVRIREIAQQEGISVESARRAVAADFDEALAWWREFEADPKRRAAFAEQVPGDDGQPTRQ
jgi:hypothetical protein